MVTPKRVIVAHSAACLWPILVIIEHIICQVGQLTEVFFDVQNVWVQIEILISIRVRLEQIFEPINGNVILLSLVAPMGNLIPQIDRAGEGLEQGCIQADRDFLLLDVKVKAGKVEIEHPVVLQLVKYLSFCLRDKWA